jgi:hypothetical protein
VEQIEAVDACNLNPAEQGIVGHRHPVFRGPEFRFRIPRGKIRSYASRWIKILHRKR